MINLKCKCGGNRFTVHHVEAKARCENCYTYFKFDSVKNAWIEWHQFHEVAKAFVHVCERTIQQVEEKVQSIGEWLKERGIQKYRKPHNWMDCKTVELKVSPELLFGNKKMQKEFTLKEKWKNEIKALENGSAVWFGSSFHFGKLRGAHIGKKLHRDLKRLGIDSELVFVDDGVWVKPIQVKTGVCG